MPIFFGELKKHSFMQENTPPIFRMLLLACTVLFCTNSSLAQCTLAQDASYTRAFINPTGVAVVNAAHLIDESNSDQSGCSGIYYLTATYADGSSACAGTNTISFTCDDVGEYITIAVAAPGQPSSFSTTILIDDVS